MRFGTSEDVQRLVDDGVAESPSLEFKRELPMQSPGARVESLKDLTAMGNGGGGTVLYGIDEADGDWPAASALTPLTDRRLVARLEDLVRDGVRPPLLFDLTVIDVDGGFILAADVQPSPLGPYMVTARGNYRYHRRIGRRTEPMDEQQVRDAYALGLRARDRRADLWQSHALPMPAPSSDPWMIVSALPEEPLLEILDLGAVDPDALRSPPDVKYHVQVGHLGGAVERLGRWSDGLFGHDGQGGDSVPYASVRLHRDGAAALARRLHSQLSAVFVARLLNAQLAYLSWFWASFSLARPLELHVELTEVSSTTLEYGSWLEDRRVVHEPPGVPATTLSLTDYVLPWELARASVRHRVVQRFSDRLYQAFGLSRAVPLFRSGQLYRRDGPLGYSVAGGVWTDTGTQIGVVHSDGSVTAAETGFLVAWWLEGCLLTLGGDTMGILEMAPGLGTPDNYLPTSLREDPRATGPGYHVVPPPPTQNNEAPTPTGWWTEEAPNLIEAFRRSTA